jgi:hypothetical protein
MMERPGFGWVEDQGQAEGQALLTRRKVNLETNRLYFHDARTVTVTKKSRLGIKHWG